jgi:hypothetical protein
MSSGLSSITTYLSIVKNEQKQVAQMMKSDPALQRTVSAFQKDAVSIALPSNLLSGKNQPALQVVLGAYNMSGKSTETGLLKKLLTQDPSVKGSLVRSLASADTLHFVKAMTNRATVSLSFGNPAAASFVPGGSAASSISMQNLSWGNANGNLTAAAPAKSWSYVLDDGTAAASIATALTTAVRSTGTTANPVTTSYSVNAGGVIVGSAGAPAITTSTDSVGNTVYSLALAANGAGATIRLANVVGVKMPAPVNTTPATTTISAAIATPLLAKALLATGFNLQTSGPSSLSILNPIDNGPLSLSQQSYASFAALTPRAISINQNVLPLGIAGASLSAGQVLTSGGAMIGTIKSVDAAGDVTLAAASALAVTANSEIDVAIGAGITNIGTRISAASASAIGDTTLALGTAAIGLQPGQIITDGSNVVGIVNSVDQSGQVTLRAGMGVAIASGDMLSIVPQVISKQTPALQDASNVKTILSSYETTQCESQEGKQVPGMDDALYFSRIMPSITSITQLMSDTTLLKVVTTNLGLSDTYAQLPYDQQLSLLTSKVKLSTFSNPAKLQNYAEQYLALTGAQSSSAGTSTDLALSLLTGSTARASVDLMSVLYPGSGSGTNGVDLLLSALYA